MNQKLTMKAELKLFDVRRDIYYMPEVIFCRWSVHDTEYTWVFNDQLLTSSSCLLHQE